MKLCRIKVYLCDRVMAGIDLFASSGDAWAEANRQYPAARVITVTVL